MKRFLLLIPFFICMQLNAQVSLNSGNGNASADIGSMSYSVGQLFYNSLTSENFELVEGVQQPFLISESGMLDVKLTAEVYPNPVVDSFTLTLKDSKNVSYEAILVDMGGKLIKRVSIVDQITTFNVESLIKGIYTLSITDRNQVVKVFKIIKL